MDRRPAVSLRARLGRPEQLLMFDEKDALWDAVSSGMKPKKWVCSKCGNDDQTLLRIDPSRPGVDDRYAVGYCDTCTPSKRSVKGPKRDHVDLVNATHWDRKAFLGRVAAEADAKLLYRFRQGHVLTDADIERVKAIVGRDAR